MSSLYFFLTNLATFSLLIDVTITVVLFFIAFTRAGVTPLGGVTLHLFYLSDLVSPLFFVNLPTNFFPSGVTLPKVSPGAVRPSLVTPLVDHNPMKSGRVSVLRLLTMCFDLYLFTYLNAGTVIRFSEKRSDCKSY